jgi:hypothetical protein
MGTRPLNLINLKDVQNLCPRIFQSLFRYYEDEYEGMNEKRIDYLLRKEREYINAHKLSKNIDTYFYNRWLRRN